MKRVFAVYPRERLMPCSEKFEQRPEAGWLMLQRVCFWLLRKIGANTVEYVATTHVTLDGERLSLMLLDRHRREVEMLMFRPGRFIIGAEDWKDVLGEIRTACRFQAPVDLRRGNMSLFNIDVTVLPWMRGVVLLPKEFD